ncbi:MAG TPA: M24 family metallopeptidase, partial [Stackebrandtia sp.]|uniref:M24 family metallopeptidase n=1 Tax=Stackebrandtia sp. TaxID=2023065 RepID=UPI002D4305A1
WVDCSRLAAEVRSVKSPAELGLVRRAAAVSSQAMAAAIATAAAGVAERDIAAAVHAAMIAAGGRPPGFVPLIRSTHRLAQEHVTWGDHVLSGGEGVFVELSGCVGRYHAPLSRIIHCGPPPSGAEAAAAAAEAGFAAALDRLRPGVRGGEVYRAWEDAVASATGIRQRRHHCGYATGIGFSPSWVGGARVRGLSAAGRGVVAAGMVFHVMSWVSLPHPAVRSDTVIVTADGCQVATTAPSGLLISS